MRPGRADDLPRLIEMWRAEVAAGRQDTLPNEEWLRRRLAHYDWEAQTRVVEDGGRIAGSVMVISRPSPDGIIATLHAAGEPQVYVRLVDWGVTLSHAAGASVVQLFVGKGLVDGLEQTGLRPVRPWWRMDRAMVDLPQVPPVAGFALADARAVPPSSWAEMFNRTFADHWRFAPRGEGEIIGGREPELCLMAITASDRTPAGIAVGELEDYPGDPRPQPVGLISSVGTLPEHRRQGLATWLVAEVLRRLRDAGARSASLYVDGASPVKAFDVYRKMGFEVAKETEVWEATFP
jgi:ribosomal protein S18 acetylase RimI-like enzyme